MPESDDRPHWSDYAYVWPQYLLPHHALSRLVLAATRWRAGWWKQLLIEGFRRRYQIDLREAVETDPRAYAHFNAFFTRALQATARPFPDAPTAIASPVDGCVSQIGDIQGDRVFQAKGRHYSLLELLGGASDLATRFTEGHFATLYLSPRDYHRIHMPLDGQLQHCLYVPGRLFSVAPHTVRRVPRLFARNERLIACFDTPAGPMALILVGALFVACIETVWSGIVTPPHQRKVRREDLTAQPSPIRLPRGQEMGRFNMGSTVIILFSQGTVRWLDHLQPGTAVRMGETLGTQRVS